MQTPTHTLLALAILAKNGQPIRNRFILIGSLIPDAFIYIFWVWLSFNGAPQDKIWNEIYFEQGVQFWGAISNSIPLYLSLAIMGWVTRGRKYGGLLLVFALSALIHLATDFPVHAEDAHQHFWPISKWRFYSPLSYWNIQHFGRSVGFVETSLGLGLVTLLLRRFTLRSTRIFLYLTLSLYIIMLFTRILFLSGIFSA